MTSHDTPRPTSNLTGPTIAAAPTLRWRTPAETPEESTRIAYVVNPGFGFDHLDVGTYVGGEVFSTGDAMYDVPLSRVRFWIPAAELLATLPGATK